MQRLREARSHLADRPTPRSELAAAFRCVWHGSSRWHEWPPSMRGWAEGLFGACFRTGGIDASVAALTDAQAAAAAVDVRRFVDDAERFNSGRPVDAQVSDRHVPAERH